MSKVYFGISGIGQGHVHRCMPVARLLRKQGHECIMSTYGGGLKIIEQEGFRKVPEKPRMWYENEDGTINKPRTVGSVGIVLGAYYANIAMHRRFMREEKPDIVVSDSNFAIIKAAYKEKVPVVYITNQTWIIFPELQMRKFAGFLEKALNWGNHRVVDYAKEVLVPDFPPPHTICRRNISNRFSGRTLYTGPTKRTYEGKDAVMQSFEGKKFIYAAISGPPMSKISLSEQLASVLANHPTPSLVVRGSHNDKPKPEPQGNCTVIDWLDNREPAMQRCDIVICRAGLATLSEVVQAAKPAIVIPQKGHPEQQANASTMQEMGISVTVQQDDVTKESINAAIERLGTSEVRQSVARVAGAVAEMDGAPVIAEHISTLL